jgi:hypothetical protein
MKTHAKVGNVFVMGSGEFSCGTWVESKNIPELRVQGIQWVLGFMTGGNWATHELQAKPPDLQAVAAFMDQYCERNVLNKIMDGAVALVLQLRANPSTQYRGK